jgi:RNA polymerase sigma factor (sigma-70 family)
MPRKDVGSTSASLLRKAGDWGDHRAWTELHERYDPLIRSCCRSLGLKGEVADGVCQDTWIEVAKRLRSFAYDPQRSFRGWLWTVCRHKAFDLLERRNRDRVFALDDRDEAGLSRLRSDQPSDWDDDEEEHASAYGGLLREAREIHAVVRRRVEARTWEAFWLVVVRFWPAGEVAEQLGMTTAAVYKASQRVLRMLQTEGRRRRSGDAP